MKIRASWQIFLLEIRQVLSYRVDFWVNFIAGVAVHIAIAYFLWGAIFYGSGSEKLGGFSFEGIVLYFVLVRFVDAITGNDAYDGEFSKDIYEGTLNRYLVYPISFVGYKFTARMARSFLRLLQALLALTVFAVIFGVPADLNLSVTNSALSLVAMFSALMFYFAISYCLQLIAFWVDNVWSLLVALRFIARFLGGGYVPLTLFPEWAQQNLQWLPFSGLIWVPIQSFLGKMEMSVFIQSQITILVWTLVVAGVARLVWMAGIRKYSGVGI